MYLVLAGFVDVPGEVAHVGDVHHVRHFIAEEAEGAGQDVVEDVGSEVADVRVIVDGGPAAVETRLAGADRREVLELAAERVV
jgi:hypothetical protein